MTIDLHFNEQQRLISDTAREFLRRHSTPAIVRKYWGAEEDVPRGLWKEMAELGWMGMCIPSEYGGLDCSFLDMYALFIEIGRFLLPGPHLDSIGLGSALVVRAGSNAQKQHILPQVARGELILAVAMLEPEGLSGSSGVSLSAQRFGQGFKLNGTKVLVSCVQAAGLLIAPARTGGQAGDDGVTLFLVDPRAQGVIVERTPNIGGLPLYAVTFEDVFVALDDVLGEVDRGWRALDESMTQAAVLQAAMIVGAGQHLLEMSVDYAKSREQFGIAIGKHQSVQYLITDIAMAAHNTELLALHAAWRISTGRPFLREAALAKAAASQATAIMSHSAHEVHAGIGFIVDHDLHLYTRRLKHWDWNLGDQRHHMERVVSESIGP